MKLSRLISILILVSLSPIVLANSGQAIIPTNQSYFTSNDNFQRSIINVSNITNKPVTITIKIYNQDGNLVIDGDGSETTGNMRGVHSFTNYSESLTGKTVEFTLAANGSAGIYLLGDSGSTDLLSYGTIKWQQNSKATVALIANISSNRFSRISGQQSSGKTQMEINGGLPF